jgi:hypothetical protein
MVKKSAIQDFAKFVLLTVAFTGILSTAVVADTEFNHGAISHLVAKHASGQVVAGIDNHVVCSPVKFEQN